jgi:hypothetical protein
MTNSTTPPQRRQCTEAEFEKMLDARVQKMLQTDPRYVNAQNAEAQSAREEQIEAEAFRRLSAKFTTEDVDDVRIADAGDMLTSDGLGRPDEPIKVQVQDTPSGRLLARAMKLMQERGITMGEAMDIARAEVTR